MTNLTGGTGFARREYVADFLRTGAFPNIHDAMGAALALIPETKRRGIMDLGACTGLLTRRANALGFSPCLGIEAKGDDVAVFNEHLAFPGCRLNHGSVDPRDFDSLGRLTSALQTYGVTTIMARRVFPEILVDTTGAKTIVDANHWGQRLGETLNNAGVEFIVLEGRVRSLRATHLLSNADLECAALSTHWEVRHRLKECRVLVPRR